MQDTTPLYIYTSNTYNYTKLHEKELEIKKQNQIIKGMDVDVLDKLSRGNQFDLANRMIYNDKAQVVFNFGKHKGKVVTDVFRQEPSYYDWMMKGDFARDTKRKLTDLKLSMSGMLVK
jgi:uncharacterized protein (DUF3820 family)